MSDNPYRQWNGAQWMVWDGAQWQPERQPYQPAKPISDGRRALIAGVALIAFLMFMVYFVWVMNSL
jgi:hypothetical protein